MNRDLIYPGQIALVENILNAFKSSMIGIAATSEAILGQTTQVSGLAATGLASGIVSGSAFAVQIGRGFIFAFEETDPSAYGVLGADTATSILKTGINLSGSNLGLANAAPAAAGFSVNYLITAAFSEVDENPQNLPFFNAANPAMPTTTLENATRLQSVVFRGTAGVPAATGTQTTPGVPSGNVPLWVVTVHNGDTAVVNGQIAAANGSPFINYTLPQLTPAAWAPPRNLKANITAASATATFTADGIPVQTGLGGTVYVVPNVNQSINLGVTGAGGMDAGTAPISGFVAIYEIYNPSTGASALLGTNATTTAAPSVYGGAFMPAGFTASTLISAWKTNASGQFVIGAQMGVDIYLPSSTEYTGTTVQTSYTALNVSSIAPPNAKTVSGIASTIPGTATSGSEIDVAGSTAGVGRCGQTASSGQSNGYFKVPILTPQTIFYITTAVSGTVSTTIITCGYSI